MTILGVRVKSAEDRRDADISFREWLPEGDAIQDADAQSDSDELLIDAIQIFDDVVKVWISGGVAGSSYSVNVAVTTAGGRIKTACLRVRVTAC